MNDTLKEQIERIASTAERAGEQAARQEQAFSELESAEAALLDATVEAAKPGLRAVSSRIQIGHRQWWPDGSVCTNDEDQYLDGRGLRVEGGGPSEDNPTANDGAVVGEDLYLLEDGRWLGVTYEGSWTRWQGRSSGWTATTRELTSLEVASEWVAASVIQTISSALESQVSGKREKATRKALERAEQVRAVTTLLERKGGKR
jgi:hypothetical protein